MCTQLSSGLLLNALEIGSLASRTLHCFHLKVCLFLKACLGNDKMELLVTSESTQLH